MIRVYITTSEPDKVFKHFERFSLAQIENEVTLEVSNMSQLKDYITYPREEFFKVFKVSEIETVY